MFVLKGLFGILATSRRKATGGHGVGCGMLVVFDQSNGKFIHFVHHTILA